MPLIPLEDNFDDVINKTQRGLKIADEDLAQRAEVSLEDLQKIKAGEGTNQTNDDGYSRLKRNTFSG